VLKRVKTPGSAAAALSMSSEQIHDFTSRHRGTDWPVLWPWGEMP